MNRPDFNIVDDTLYVYTPVPELGKNMYRSQAVMTKEMFRECYKRWIEPMNLKMKPGRVI